MPPVATTGATVAVTGATGFIGSHVVAQLLTAGYKVRAVVRNPSDAEKVAHLNALPNASERLTLWKGELDVDGSYDEAFNGADAVVHTAAVVEINDVKDPVTQIVNPSVNGVKNVLASAEKASSVKRFVHTSSEIAAMKWDEDINSTFREDSWNTVSTVENGDPYGFAKASAEKLVLDHQSSHFDVVSILPGINLGPCMTKNHTKSSAVVVRQMIYGNAQPEYNGQFVDVRDTALAHVKAVSLTLKDPDAPRFLVVQDHPMMISTLEIPLTKLFPEYVIKACPSNGAVTKAVLSIPLLWRAMVSEFQLKFNEQKFRMDNSKSKEQLGIAYRSMDETLRDTVTSMVLPLAGATESFIKPRPRGQCPEPPGGAPRLT